MSKEKHKSGQVWVSLEHFLYALWPWNKNKKVFWLSDLSNALTLMPIWQLEGTLEHFKKNGNNRSHLKDLLKTKQRGSFEILKTWVDEDANVAFVRAHPSGARTLLLSLSLSEFENWWNWLSNSRIFAPKQQKQH